MGLLANIKLPEIAKASIADAPKPAEKFDLEAFMKDFKAKPQEAKAEVKQPSAFESLMASAKSALGVGKEEKPAVTAESILADLKKSSEKAPAAKEPTVTAESILAELKKSSEKAPAVDTSAFSASISKSAGADFLKSISSPVDSISSSAAVAMAS